MVIASVRIYHSLVFHRSRALRFARQSYKAVGRQTIGFPETLHHLGLLVRVVFVHTRLCNRNAQWQYLRIQ